MSTYTYDLLVIGAGSGGVRAARMASQYGARVAICEDRRLGGTCVNVGCVPKKLFVYGSEFGRTFQDAAGYGWSVDATSFDWPTLVKNKDAEIARLNSVYGRILDNANVEHIEGHGTILGPHTVSINGKEVTAERILIATGSQPWIPSTVEGAEHGVTSDDIFSLDTLPSHITVVGGGYIGVEFTGIFRGLGVDVSLVYYGEGLLRGFDKEISGLLEETYSKDGVDMRAKTSVTSVRALEDGSFRVSMRASDGETSSLDTGLVFFATGRRANTQNLGLEHANIALDAYGNILVNEDYQTNIPSIYALGDVTGGLTLTPVALAEGRSLAARLFRPEHVPHIDFKYIPTAVFSHPNLATVGLTEEEANAAHPGEISVYTSRFNPMYNTLAKRDEKTLMKILVHTPSDRVLGCHMLGPDAGEIIQGFAVALVAGATKAQFDATIGIHPTAAEEFVTMRTPTRS